MTTIKKIATGLFLLGTTLCFHSCGNTPSTTTNEAKEQDNANGDSVPTEVVPCNQPEQSAEIVLQLPSNAKMIEKKHGVITYIQPMGQSEDEDYINAIWIADENGNNVTRVCCPKTDMESCDWKGDNHRCKTKDIIAAAEVDIVKDHKNNVYLVISGVPDSRNVFSYLVPVGFSAKDQKEFSEGEKECIHIHSAEGFAGYDSKKDALIFYDYNYNQNTGRYSFKEIYDFNGNMIEKGEPEYN